MKAIPTVDNSGFCQTCGAVQPLVASDKPVPQVPQYDPDIYLSPVPNAGDRYLQPSTGDLYKRPGSP